MSNTVNITLPSEKSVVTRHDPRILILYAPPKAGKTTLLSTLPNNLILDLEEGAQFVEALSINIIGWDAPNTESAEVKEKRHKENKLYMSEAGRAIIDAGKPYDFITVDTATELEEMVKPLALQMYQATPMGGNFKDDILTLPRGAGYYWLRMAFKACIEKITKLADNIILVGHLKDTFVTKEGKEVQAKDLALTGKIKEITCAGADAIGYLHRGKDNELIQ
jgi:hypothetical protein